jgi:hypothetical protein
MIDETLKRYWTLAIQYHRASVLNKRMFATAVIKPAILESTGKAREMLTKLVA